MSSIQIAICGGFFFFMPMNQPYKQPANDREPVGNMNRIKDYGKIPNNYQADEEY